MALPEGFVEQDGSGGGGVEGFHAALHGNLDAGIGGVDDIFRQAGALVANEKGDRLAPIDFPRGSEGLRCAVVRTSGDGRDVVEFELSEENSERRAVDEGKVKGRSGGGTKGFGGKGTGRAGLAGGRGDSSGGAERHGGAHNGAHVAGVLDSCEYHNQG